MNRIRTILSRGIPFPGGLGTTCVLVLVLWAVVALFAPWIAPVHDNEIVSSTSFARIGEHGVLGTDYLGRDVFSRLVYGARMTIGLALAATVLAFLLGVVTGFVAGIAGGITDTVISRAVDAFVSFPTIMLALIVISGLGSSLLVLVATVGFIEATRVFRISRSLALNIMTMDFVDISRARGEGLWWILWHEVLPNAFAVLSTDFGLRFTFSILLLSSLSFLGLGIQPPSADWGGMVKENLSGIYVGTAAIFAPAIAIFSVTFAVNTLVDWNLSRTRRDISDELLT